MSFDDVRRRSYLASMAGGLAALAGCPGDGREATELLPESPTPESRQPNMTDMIESVQTSANGMVVPVFHGDGSDAAIDPSSTETPIQDAIDTIENETAARLPGGTVLLPPGQITEAGPLLRTRYKRFLGWGTFATTVRFTDRESPGIAQDPDVPRDAQQTYWDGIKFVGGGGDLEPGDRTAPWLHLQGHGRKNENSIGGFNVGRIRLDFWGDPVIRFENRSHVFESHWEWLEMKNKIFGRAILIEEPGNFGGSGWSCSKLNLRRSDPGRIIDARGNGGGSFTVHSLHLMHDLASSQDVPAVDVRLISGISDMHINQLHWESGGGGGRHRMPSLFRVRGGSGMFRIDDLAARAGSFDYVGELVDIDQARIGRLSLGDFDLRETRLRITGNPPGGWYQRGNVVYDGPSEHITDETGSQYGHVFAVGDQKVVDPLFQDSVTHTTGGETRIRRINESDRMREVEKLSPQIQTLEPAAMPGEPFGIDHRFEWIPDGDYGRWDLILEWTRDPGIDIEFDVEVTARSADGHGVRLGGL